LATQVLLRLDRFEKIVKSEMTAVGKCSWNWSCRRVDAKIKCCRIHIEIFMCQFLSEWGGIRVLQWKASCSFL